MIWITHNHNLLIKSWRTSVETQEKNLKSKKRWCAAENFSEEMLEEDGDVKEKKNQEWDRKSAETLSQFLFHQPFII